MHMDQCAVNAQEGAVVGICYKPENRVESLLKYLSVICGKKNGCDGGLQLRRHARGLLQPGVKLH